MPVAVLGRPHAARRSTRLDVVDGAQNQYQAADQADRDQTDHEAQAQGRLVGLERAAALVLLTATAGTGRVSTDG